MLDEEPNDGALPSASVSNKGDKSWIARWLWAILLAVFTNDVCEPREFLKSKQAAAQSIYSKPASGMVAVVKLLSSRLG